MTRRLLCGVRVHPNSAGVIAGSVAAAATTGALIAMGHRIGHAGIPFAAIGAVPFQRTTSGAVGLVFTGLVFHVVAVFVWSVICVWVARHWGRPIVASIAVAIANFLASWIVAWSSGRGLATVLQLGDRLALAVVLAAALVVGMRYAFSRREIGVRADERQNSLM